MTSQEIGKWLAFDDIEPIGRDWERTCKHINYTADLKEALKAEHFAPDPIQHHGDPT